MVQIDLDVKKKKKIQYIDINNVLVTLVCAVIINNTLNLILLAIVQAWKLFELPDVLMKRY